MDSKALAILQTASDGTLAQSVLDTFKEVEKNFFLRSWKASELDSGHFVEVVRRFIDHKLVGSYTPIGKTLATFNETELKRLENATGNESYRLLIPRVLFSIYTVRNKRGVGHLSPISPNHMDATLILNSCKWVFAELLRLESTLTPQDTLAIVEQVIERPLPSIWDVGTKRRILNTGLAIRDQILFLLLSKSPQTDNELRDNIGYDNVTYFKKQLRLLHKSRWIEYSPDGQCVISPTGTSAAEKIAHDMANLSTK